MKTIDLTHLITETMPVYPGCEAPVLSMGTTIADDGFRETLLHLYSHTGTHMDAPSHLLPNGVSLDDLPVDRFIGPGLVIDCSSLRAGERITMAHLSAYEAMLPMAEYVLFYTGWDRYWNSATYLDAFPVPELDVLQCLIQYNIKGIGTDAISIDPIGDDLPRHHVILEAGLVNVENLTHLHALCDQSFLFCAMPLHYQNADGAPVRAVGLILDQ